MSKVGAISKAQKALAFKIVKGGPFGFLKLQFVAKSQKLKDFLHHCETFFRSFFKRLQRVLPSICFDILQQNEC